MLLLSITGDIKFGVINILRTIGMGLINAIYSTIDVLYDVAYKINSMDFISMLKNIDNSPFTKLFNSFFILSFTILFLFSVWKLTFKIFDADENDQPFSFLIKEIFKCGFLIFLVNLIFVQTINISVNLSGAIYHNFSNSQSSIGNTMKTAYLNLNKNCYFNSGNESYHSDMGKVEKKNREKLSKQLADYVNLPNIETVADFTPLIRNGTLTASNIIDSGAFSLTCQIYKAGIWNDGEDYFFEYNWLFGVIVGGIFLFAIGFCVIMLGRRQIELAFLMIISPLVFATSIGRKEQRSALYQQLTSLILQAGALLLLIGLTSIIFSVIQNNEDLNALPDFTKLVSQSVLYLGCAMMLISGSTTLNRFIGENVSANSGRDSIMALKGISGGMLGAGAMGYGVIKGGTKTLQGSGRMLNAGRLGLAGMTNGEFHLKTVNSMNSKLSKAEKNIASGKGKIQNGSVPTKLAGIYQQYNGNRKVNSLNKKWDFDNQKVRNGYFSSGRNLATRGIGTIAHGFTGNFRAIRNYENLKKSQEVPFKTRNK